MYCTNCGAEVDPNSRYCTSCGADLRAQRSADEATTVMQEPGTQVLADSQPGMAAQSGIATQPGVAAQPGATNQSDVAAQPGMAAQFGATAQPAQEYPATQSTAQWADQTQVRQDAPYMPAAVPSPPQQTYVGEAHPKYQVPPAAIAGIVAAVAVACVIGLGVAGVIPNPFAGASGVFGAVASSNAGSGGSSDSTGSTATGSITAGSTSANGSSSSNAGGSSSGSSNASNSASSGGSAANGSNSRSSSSQGSSDGGASSSSTATQYVGFKGITNATASSTLATDKISSYGPLHLLDGDPSTCWAEGVDGLGVGESVTLSGDGVQTFSGFRIANGFQKSEKIYYMNPRASQIEVQVDGQKIGDISPRTDDYGYMDDFSFSQPIDGTSITFVIKDVVAGSRYQDTSISDITVY